MRTHIFLFAALALAAVTANAQQLPEKVYLHQHDAHRTAVFNYPYLQGMDIVHRRTTIESLVGKNDSIRFTIADGQQFDYLYSTVDSITFFAPDESMRANMAYQNQNYRLFYPTYSDDYRGLSGWGDRSQWQLANIHDPTVMKAADGYFYMSQTDAGFGNPQSGKGHFYVRRSKDMVNWEPASNRNNSCVLREATPEWLLPAVNDVRQRRGLQPLTQLSGLGYWAPTMRRVNDNLYRMYYSIVIGNGIKTGSPDFDGSWNENSWIGLAETTDPASGVWEDKGAVLCSASDRGKDDYGRANPNDYNAYCRFNAIDPSFIITPSGEHWLIYGSWHSGIAAIQLDPETGKTMEPLGDPWNIGTGQNTTYGQLIATRNKASRWQGSEGAEVIYNPETGYYYLFLAYDELDVPYNTRVVRSYSVNGPYYGIDGRDVTYTGGDAFPIVTHPYQFKSDLEHDGWVGISHCAVWDDGQGNWYFSSQGRKPNDYSNSPEWAPNAIMMGHVRRIYWTSDGWPIVSPERYGNVEQAPIAASDLVGKWELIDLAYQKGVQKTSQEVTIKPSSVSADRVVMSGAFSGSGRFNNDTHMLSITSSGNQVEFNVERELDWEASPRCATIVMTAIRNNTHTLWLKRVGDAE